MRSAVLGRSWGGPGAVLVRSAGRAVLADYAADWPPVAGDGDCERQQGRDFQEDAGDCLRRGLQTTFDEPEDADRPGQDETAERAGGKHRGCRTQDG